MSTEPDDTALRIFRFSIIALAEQALLLNKNHSRKKNDSLLNFLQSIIGNLGSDYDDGRYLKALMSIRASANDKIIDHDTIKSYDIALILLALDMHIAAIPDQNLQRERISYFVRPITSYDFHKTISETYYKLKLNDRRNEKISIADFAHEFIAASFVNLSQQKVYRDHFGSDNYHDEMALLERELDFIQTSLPRQKFSKGTLVTIPIGYVSQFLDGIRGSIGSYIDKTRRKDVIAPLSEIKKLSKLTRELSKNFRHIANTAARLQHDMYEQDRQLQIYSEWASEKLKQHNDAGVAR